MLREGGPRAALAVEGDGFASAAWRCRWRDERDVVFAHGIVEGGEILGEDLAPFC